MDTSQQTPNDFDALKYVQAQVKRFGTPVSDGSAEASIQAAHDAAGWIYPYYGTPTPEDIAKGMSHLTRAIDADWRRTGCMADLLRFAQVDLRKAVDTLIDVVDLSTKIGTGLDAESPGGNWSIGPQAQRERITTAAVCAMLLDMAGRYHNAHAVRLKALKHDARDGSGMRYDVVAHALMVGDVALVQRWLKWAIKLDQVRAFWDWAETLHALLVGRDNALDIARRAHESEPYVAAFLLEDRPSTVDFSRMCIVRGSKQEQHYHATMLWRAWAAHPMHREWLQDALPTLAKGGQNGR